MNKIASWIILVLVLTAGAAQAATLVVDAGGGGDYTDITSAIVAAASGDTISIVDGIYAESLDIDKTLSLIGQSEAGVVIDASGFDDSAIDVQGDFAFAFSDFTLIGNSTFATAFGLVIAGDAATCDVRRVTIQDCYRTGLDLNGLDGGVVEDCTISDTVDGAGLGMTDCSNITISGLTTSDNAWAGIGIFTDGTVFTGGSDNIVLTGVNNLGEPVPLYTEEANGFLVTNLDVPVADFGALSGSTLTPGVVAYVQSVAIAQAGVLANDPANGWVVDRTTGAYAVAPGMSIQAAIAAAEAGDVIGVDAGTYSEGTLTFDKGVTLSGANAGVAYDGGRGPETIIADTRMTFADGTDGVIVDGLFMTGLIGGGALIDMIDLSVSNFTMTNSIVSDINTHALYGQGAGIRDGITFTNTRIHDINDGDDDGVSDFSALNPWQSANVTVDNCLIERVDNNGLNLETVAGATVTNSIFRDIGKSGIEIANACTGPITITDNAFQQCNQRFVLDANVWYSAIKWDSGDPVLTATGTAVITGNTIENCVVGYLFAREMPATGLDITFSDNLVTGNSVAGFLQYYPAGAAHEIGFNYWGDGGPAYGVFDFEAWFNDPAGITNINIEDFITASGPGDRILVNATTPTVVDASPAYGFLPGTSPMTWLVNAPGSIQAAIDAAAAGDAITVGAGVYEEQLHITTDGLTITGAGVGATSVTAPADMPLFFTTSEDNYPIVFVDGASGTTLSGLTIDGQGNGALNYRFVGLGLHNADGGYGDLRVTQVRNEPLDGTQHGFGLYVINDDAAARTVSFTDVAVDDVQQNATVFSGDGLVVEALRLACTGNGTLGVGLPVQNGIQVSAGAFANIVDCTMADYNSTDPSGTASGLLVFGPGSADLTGGSITGTQTSITYVDASGTVDGVTVTDPQGDALYAYAGTPAAKATGAPRVLPRGVDAAPVGSPDKADQTFVLLNSTFTGNDLVDSWGPTAYAVDGNVDFTVQGCTIEHFDNGLNLFADGGTVTGSASGNLIRDNLTYGGFSNTIVPFDARDNDWGDISGPYHPTLNPTGLGNAVSDNILFEPWTGQAGLGVTPVASGPLTCGQTLELTFQYTADEATPDMFLYNIVVRIPPQLFFNTVRDELPFGTVNNNFFVVDNLDGTWTFTGSTVGNPTSPVVGPGTFDLFTIVAQTATDGLGDVVIEDFALRDPENAPIPAGVSGATVLVDCTAPAAAADIVALPGHTKIDVSWTHDGTDVDYYEVFVGEWQDGSGNSAYPEYDDLPADVVPTRPATYAEAVASAEWTSLGPLTVTELTQTWSDATDRGVYYYEVFAIDTAGNASAPAAANDRATNYWLGDVYGDTAGDYVGNGLVNVRDVNYLAASYGDPVPEGNPDNVLDVGPTDDTSRLGVPLTDNILNFEDLMIFSMNFGVVAPAKDRAPVGSRIALAWVDYGDGRYGLRLAEGASLKGLRVTAGVGVNGVEAGALLDEQAEPTFVANVGDRLDASVAVMGTNIAFAGVGDLLLVDAAAAIDVDDLVITARAADNSDLEVTIDTTSDTLTPRVFALYPNYPNPFNPTTKISFSLPESQPVRLVVYSVDGRLVRTLVDEARGPGLHEVIWNGEDDTGRQSASGVYFYRVDAGPYSEVHKMTLMK